ncbi:hypothetical protein [Robertmurraya mangrovi]|nr:hypothetical protein [Bacillus sp. 31A1R]
MALIIIWGLMVLLLLPEQASDEQFSPRKHRSFINFRVIELDGSIELSGGFVGTNNIDLYFDFKDYKEFGSELQPDELPTLFINKPNNRSSVVKFKDSTDTLFKLCSFKPIHNSHPKNKHYSK